MNQIKRDGFILKYLIEGQGEPALVIGSVDYYPKMYSENLRNHLKLIFTDHRGFAKATEPFDQSDYTLDKIVDDIEGLRQRGQVSKKHISRKTMESSHRNGLAIKYLFFSLPIGHTVLRKFKVSF